MKIEKKIPSKKINKYKKTFVILWFIKVFKLQYKTKKKI